MSVRVSPVDTADAALEAAAHYNTGLHMLHVTRLHQQDVDAPPQHLVGVSSCIDVAMLISANVR